MFQAIVKHMEFFSVLDTFSPFPVLFILSFFTFSDKATMARVCLMVIITVFDFSSYSESTQILSLERLLKIWTNKALRRLNEGWVRLISVTSVHALEMAVNWLCL